MLQGGKTNLWSLQPSPAQSSSSHRVQVTLEVETASPLDVIPKGAKPPLHGVRSSILVPQAAQRQAFSQCPHPTEPSFAPKGRHLDIWIYPYQALCVCALTHAIAQRIVPPGSFICARTGSYSTATLGPILLPDESQSLPCQVPLWVGDTKLDFNSSWHL